LEDPPHDLARVSSMPNSRVGSGAGSHLAAALINAVWAVSQDTPYSPATSDTARLADAIASAIFSRSRFVSLARGGTSFER